MGTTLDHGWIRLVDEGYLADADRLRQDFHRHPELAFQERRTAGVVAERLRAWGAEVVAEGVAGTGVVGLIRGGRPGRCVALRAEMDALPIEEQTGLAFASIHSGIMHACGHDGHMAILLTCARMLAEVRQRLAGSIKFVFQPAEEQGAGAARMVEAGVLREEPAVDAIFALHARPRVAPGRIELSPVPSAASDAFTIRVHGTGCHAAYPHLGTDPIAIGCQIVTALQQIVARQVAPFDSAVVSVGSFHAGSRGNIIPAEAELGGTVRTRDPRVRKQVIAAVERIVTGCARALGGRAELQLRQGYPRVCNHPALTGLVRKVGLELLGAGNVLDATEATMGAEDFAFYLEEQGGVPGCLFRLGVETEVFVHTPAFDFGHDALAPGILMAANIALQYLGGEDG